MNSQLRIGDQTFDTRLDFFLCPTHGLIVPARFDSCWTTDDACPVILSGLEACGEDLAPVYMDHLAAYPADGCLVALTKEEIEAELASRPEKWGHDTDVWGEPAYHPSGEEYSLGVASCRECDWTFKGDPEDALDAAGQHSRETAAPDIVAEKLGAALNG